MPCDAHASLRFSLIFVRAAQGAACLAQVTVPELAFDANADLLRTPAEIYLGEVGGVGRNSQGRIFVYTRTGHPYATLGDNRTFYRGGSRLFEFDAGGKFVRELGQDVYGFNTAFGLRVDPQDNVWTIDQSASQVVKFDTQGRVVLVLGRSLKSSTFVRPRRRPVGPAAAAAAGGGARAGGPAPPPDRGLLAPPSASRATWRGIAPATSTSPTAWVPPTASPSSTRTASSSVIGVPPAPSRAVQRREGAGRSTRRATSTPRIGNKRIQVFDADGTFKSQFGGVGLPMALCMTTGATQYLYMSHVGDQSGMDDATIYKVQLDGKVVGRFGSAGKLPKEFGVANSIDCRNENELLIGEMSNWRVQKVTLKR